MKGYAYKWNDFEIYLLPSWYVSVAILIDFCMFFYQFYPIPFIFDLTYAWSNIGNINNVYLKEFLIYYWRVFRKYGIISTCSNIRLSALTLNNFFVSHFIFCLQLLSSKECVCLFTINMYKYSLENTCSGNLKLKELNFPHTTDKW